jgi:hypothetical protein
MNWKESKRVGDNFTKVDSEEYEVYSVFFRNEYDIERRSGNESKKQYVDGMTNCDDRPEISVGNHGDGIEFDSNLVSEFEKKNIKKYRLDNRIMAPQGIVILSKQEMKDAFAEEWESFYKKYPDAEGITAFSRVGFNADKTKAVFYSELRSGGEEGAAWLYFAHKNSYGWVCRPISEVWIS